VKKLATNYTNYTKFVCLLLLLLVGCVDAPTPEATGVATVATATVAPTETVVTVTAEPTRTVRPSLTPSPSVTLTPLPTNTETVTPTPAPTVAIWVGAGTPMVEGQEVIAAENVGRLTELARWGRGVIRDVAFSADGQWLAVATTQGVYLHDGHDLAAEPRYLATERMVDAIAFSPDGSLLALETADYGDRDGWQIEMRQLPDGELLYRQPGSALYLSFSPDGEVLILHGLPSMTLWHSRDGMLFRSYPSAAALAFSPDGQTVALGVNRQVVFHDWASDAEIGVMETIVNPDEPGYFVDSLAYSADGEAIAIGFQQAEPASRQGGSVQVRQVSDGAVRYVIERQPGLEWSLAMMDCTVRYRADPISPPAPRPVRFSPDGRTLAVLYDGGRFYEDEYRYNNFMNLYRASDGGLVQALNDDFIHGIQAYAFAPDQDLLVVATQTGFLEARQASDGGLVEQLAGYGSPIVSLAVAPDGQSIAVGTMADTRLLRPEDGSLLRRYPLARVAFSPEQGRMAVGYEDGRVEWRRTADDALLNSFVAHNGPVVDLVFLDAERLVTAGRDCVVHLWNVVDGRLLMTFEPYQIDYFDNGRLTTLGIRQMKVTPDGRFLIGQAHSWSGVWEVASGRFLAVLPEEGYPREVAISPSDDLLVVAGTPITAWRFGQGQLGTIQWQAGMADIVAFSPSGELLAAGWGHSLANGRLELWEATVGRRIWSAYDFRLGVSAVAFSGDGRYLVAGSLDGLIRLWGVP
jgi:WD40 repeat protein